MQPIIQLFTGSREDQRTVRPTASRNNGAAPAPHRTAPVPPTPGRGTPCLDPGGPDRARDSGAPGTVERILPHPDPTDPPGQNFDRGSGWTPGPVGDRNHLFSGRQGRWVSGGLTNRLTGRCPAGWLHSLCGRGFTHDRCFDKDLLLFDGLEWIFRFFRSLSFPQARTRRAFMVRRAVP